MVFGDYRVGALKEQPVFAVAFPNHAEANRDWGPVADGKGSLEKDGFEVSLLDRGDLLHVADVGRVGPEAGVVGEHGGDGVESAEYLAGVAAVDDGVVVDSGEDGFGVAAGIGVEKRAGLSLDVGCLRVQAEADGEARNEQQGRQ